MTIGIYISTLVLLGVLDSVWLFSTGSFYKNILAHLFAPHFSYLPAVIFYLLYAAGLAYFVIVPLVRSSASLGHVFLVGAFFGLIAYAAYDLTNQATLKDWPLVVTCVDMLWGAVLSGLVSTIVYWFYSRS